MISFLAVCVWVAFLVGGLIFLNGKMMEWGAVWVAGIHSDFCRAWRMVVEAEGLHSKSVACEAGVPGMPVNALDR
ncbi:MAG: hypothetical protein HY917_01110 [Candidatus Diapherotrites archaeon]|nr:hypothetical protein [Candidatus Diapherotrites archaeon]